ncbi:DUF927 domain-containing protein [Rhizobium leguminosarum]|jgi:energy-coupling factor transporter ATP-binding protein EcfA2|uniref:DUF927 domain-containing protein n=1 Tax=Rhizobium TaxID=379 RepID=UPI001C97A2D8|nr:DUF927 domain-containing protein [Rhizobium leguminosarum]MBY5388948.1 DUF927 domain-containing protein [Rhizobium leguminosarum]
MSKLPQKRTTIKIADNVTIEGKAGTFVAVRAKSSGTGTVTAFLPRSKLLSPRACSEALLDAGLKGLYEEKELVSLVEKARVNVFQEPLKIATTTGWHGSRYVFNGKIFGHNHPDILEVHPNMSRYEYPLNQDRALFQTVIELGATFDFLAFALMLAFAGPLLAMLDKTERPVIHIWGPSRSGKTTLLNVLNALIRPPTDRSLSAFDYTARGMEEMLAKGNGQLMCFDELGTLDDARLNKAIEILPYFAGNGRGRVRSQGGGLDNSFPNLEWATIPVVTGEKDLREFQGRKFGTGQDARLLTLPVPPGPQGGILSSRRPDTAAEYARLIEKLETETKRYTGDDYESWIAYIANNRPKILKKFRKDVKTFTSRLAGPAPSNLERDIASKFAWFAACGSAMRRAKIITWPKARAEEVAQKFHDIDRDSKRSTIGSSEKQKTLARTILARVACDRFEPASSTKVDADGRDELGTIETHASGRWLVIGKENLEQSFDASSEYVVETLRSVPKLLDHRKSSPYQQIRKGGVSRSVLKINYEQLISTAFPNS